MTTGLVSTQVFVLTTGDLVQTCNEYQYGIRQEARRTAHLSVAGPEIGLGDSAPDRLGRFADGGRALGGRVDTSHSTCVGRWVAGHASRDRSLRLGEDGSVGDSGCRASGLGDATRGSLGPTATTGHGVNHNAVSTLENVTMYVHKEVHLEARRAAMVVNCISKRVRG